MSLPELDDFLQSAIQAMKAEWAEPVKGFRHLMNTILFLQLCAIRAQVEDKKVEPDVAAAFLRSDFGLGYVFGLAANFVDALSLPRQGLRPKPRS